MTFKETGPKCPSVSTGKRRKPSKKAVLKSYYHNPIGYDERVRQRIKRMMEKLGAPQTHLGLKQMIAEVDEDQDGKISFREVSLFYPQKC